jgi:hypothetical protein
MASAPWTSERFRFVFADEIAIFGVKPTGELMLFPH